MSTSPNPWPGRLVLSGMVSLFIAMACALASVALLSRPGGHVLEAGTKFFGFLWLPLVGIGALIRLSEARDESRTSQGTATGHESHVSASQAPNKTIEPTR